MAKRLMLTKQKGWKITSVWLEPKLKAFYVEQANAEGISLSDVFRRALKKYADETKETNGAAIQNKAV